MITLKQALDLDKKQLLDLYETIDNEANKNKDLGAYVEQFSSQKLTRHESMGVPIAIKDNISVDGWEMTCASKILQGYTAPYNAHVIDRLIANGLSPFGRANMDEFAMGSSTETSCYGITKNPHDPSLVPGGSSGGSAAAVAGKIAVAALGSDTGGSIRQPAAFCGCVGFKPSYGRVSRYGLTAFSSSLDQIGTLTQNVEDAAILYDIISGFDERDSTSLDLEKKPTKIDKTKRFKVAILQNFVDECDEQVQNALIKTQKVLKDLGHEVVQKNLSNHDYHIASYYILATAEASTNLARFDGVRFGARKDGENLRQMYLKTRNEGFGEEVKRRILTGTFVLSSGYFDAYYKKAQAFRHLIKQEYEDIFAHADLILAPVTKTTAFGIGSKQNPLEMYVSDAFTISVNLAGLPAMSIPIAKDPLPIGCQIIGKKLDEQSIFDLCTQIEEAIK